MLKYNFKLLKRLHIKDIKNSSYISVFVIIFLLMSLFGYFTLRDSLITNNKKDSEILFYKIQNQTGLLLSKLEYLYSFQKNILIKQHKYVADELKSNTKNPLDYNLTYIFNKLNNKLTQTPYNIYISDKNLIIKNSTYKQDIGFNLSFAKDSFDKHFKNNTVGICSPLFEKSSKKFISYTDEYLNSNKQALLQVSFTYEGPNHLLKEIQKFISKYPNIKSAKAYNILNNGFVNYIILKDFKSYKTSLDEILSSINESKKIKDRIKDNNLYINSFTKDKTSYKALYLSTTSPILNDTSIVYSILLDDTELNNKLYYLNISMIILTTLGLLSIVITFKLKEKEVKLKEQNNFVQSAMHEIKTPLSIITLNNELREIEFGNDEYSTEIDSAVKLLKTSYDDMSFTITKNKLHYKEETIYMKEILQNRVSYFKSIAKSKSKLLKLEINSNCILKASSIEIIRLIDNNLSNAIKYADDDSTINISLDNNILSFHNIGTSIKDTKNIFNKYFRENTIVGGYGLGLSIVNEVANKYNINIQLESSLKHGTKFTYILKCHTNDMSKR